MENNTYNFVTWPLKADQAAPQVVQLREQLIDDFHALLKSEDIPVDKHLSQLFLNLYLPFCHWLSSQQNKVPLIVGINGSQGSGKSTLTKILEQTLHKGFNKAVVSLSIDDLYMTRDQRLKLAQEVHPLLATRGVPGTHDVVLAHKIFAHLLNKDMDELTIPVFDKSIDDRLPDSECKKFSGQCDIVLFEGWCVGSKAQEQSALETPVNQLEVQEDPEGNWRKYVNSQLNDHYSELFSLIDIQLLLKIPDFDKVFEWRNLQEQKLKKSVTANNQTNKEMQTMSEDEIRRFIMHYERITRHTLEEMPERCDIVFEIGEDHQIKNIIKRQNE